MFQSLITSMCQSFTGKLKMNKDESGCLLSKTDLHRDIYFHVKGKKELQMQFKMKH